MGNSIVMKKNTRGFYTIEAAIFLPIIVLAVLSMGYFMRVEGTWENCIHAAVDESMKSAAKAYDKGFAIINIRNLEDRLHKENPCLSSVEIIEVRTGYPDIKTDKLTSYRISASMELELPMGFQREFHFKSKIKFRGFVGKKVNHDPMGEGELEKESRKRPVYIFPQSGEKYHRKNCTYVKATVHQQILTNHLKRRYDSCSICDSGELNAGSIVFCFESENTAYHRGSCGTIKKYTVIIDITEAQKRGYEPCSKCGGG